MENKACYSYTDQHATSKDSMQTDRAGINKSIYQEEGNQQITLYSKESQGGQFIYTKRREINA